MAGVLETVHDWFRYLTRAAFLVGGTAILVYGLHVGRILDGLDAWLALTTGDVGRLWPLFTVTGLASLVVGFAIR